MNTMKNKIVYLQPAILAICVGLYRMPPLFDGMSDWELIFNSFGFIYGICVPIVWVLGIGLIWNLIQERLFKHALIILCLNICISLFYDGIYVFTHLGRKDDWYIPKTIQDAKEKGAFICEYEQTNRVVLFDSIDLSVDEAFICHLCYYDDKDILHAHPNHHKKDFVASLKNQEQLKSLDNHFYIDCGYKSYYLNAGKWTKVIEIDSVTGIPPENLVFRITHSVRNEDSVFVSICIDSICLVRVPERMTN